MMVTAYKRPLTRSERRQMEQENARYPDFMEQVPASQWAHIPINPKPLDVWRSRSFLVQVYAEPNGIVRLSINSTSLDRGDDWVDAIPWEVLQKIKRECGYGDRDAVEVFPRDADVVNVANIRHLFVLPDLLPYAWRRGCQSG